MRMSPDRIVMIIFAVLEFLALLWGLIELGIVLGKIHKYADRVATHVTHADFATSGDTSRAVNPVVFEVYPNERLVTITVWNIVLFVLSMLSLIGVTLYYTLGKELQKRHLIPKSFFVGGGYRIWLKMINIAVGAIGIVVNGAAVSLCAVSVWYSNQVKWKNAAEAKLVQDQLVAATVVGLVAIVLKLAEALLGHYWAIDLSRGRCVHMLNAQSATAQEAALVHTMKA